MNYDNLTPSNYYHEKKIFLFMKKNISCRENKYFVHEKNLKLSVNW